MTGRAGPADPGDLNSHGGLAEEDDCRASLALDGGRKMGRHGHYIHITL